MAHSPLPFSFDSKSSGYLKDANGKTIADFRYKNGFKDAPMVVHCVNNHQALVDALEQIASTSQNASLQNPEQFCEWAYHTATEALSKARQEETV